VTVPNRVFEEYWRRRVQAAHLRLEAALQIIEHNPTRGTSAENLLRSLLLEFLPSRWSIGNGFIVDAEGNISKQVDALIYDAMTASATYKDGELVVLPTDTAAIAIEVKSNLDERAVSEAVDNAASVKSIDPKVVHITFAYRSARPETIAKHLRAKLKVLRKSGKYDPEKLPDRFYALNTQLVVTRPEEPGPAVYVGFVEGEPVIRFLFSQLLSTLKLRNLQAFIQAEYNREIVFEVK
jgi:hypothetical protein